MVRLPSFEQAMSNVQKTIADKFVDKLGLRVRDPETGKMVFVNTAYKHGDLSLRYSKCNPTALDVFGITGSKIVTSFPATNSELGICRKNKDSCCEYSGMIKTVSRLKSSFRICAKYFSFVEKLLTLFRGDIYKLSLLRAKEAKHCHVAALGTISPEIRQNFFNKEYITENIKKIEDLIEDHSDYQRSWQELYGNIICSICNPSEVRFWTFGECRPSKKEGSSECYSEEEMEELKSKYSQRTNRDSVEIDPERTFSSLVLDDSTVIFLLMMKSFEYKLMTSMIEFMIPFANLIRCLNDKEDDPDFVVDPIKVKIVYREQILIEDCLRTTDLGPCKRLYNFIPTRLTMHQAIFTQGQQLYRIFYLQFISGGLPVKFKHSNAFDELSYKIDNNCKIYPTTTIVKKYRVKSMKFMLSDNGARLSLSKIHPLFLGTSAVSVLEVGLAIWAVLSVGI